MTSEHLCSAYGDMAGELPSQLEHTQYVGDLVRGSVTERDTLSTFIWDQLTSNSQDPVLKIHGI